MTQSYGSKEIKSMTARLPVIKMLQ